MRARAAVPVLRRADALRRRIQGRLRSFDLLRWEAVAYGSDPAQRMRVWELNDLSPRDGWPAVLLLHGGGWREGSSDEFAAMGPALARRGIYAAAVDYRLAPEHLWPAMREDVALALQFLHAQPVDPSRIAVWGGSAGGHLALMLALERSHDVRCAVAVGAPTDLERLDSTDTGGVFGTEDLVAASPVHAACAQPPPILLLHGERDAVVDPEHARRLHERFPSEVEVDLVPGGDHGLRWPPWACLRARRRAIQWMIDHLDPAPRPSKWRIRRRQA